MIQKFDISNFGPITHLRATDLQNINLVIGRNGSGKTILLKALYAAIKTIEQYKRGRDVRTDKDILADKLRWTFQAQVLKNIIKNGESRLSFQMVSSDNETFEYSFGTSTTKEISNLTNTFAPRPSDNSVFIPAKEVLSLRNIILKWKNQFSDFGFDDTFVDLASALTPTDSMRSYNGFTSDHKELEQIMGGRLEYDKEYNEWMFKDKNNKKIEISLTAEGIKKLSIIDLLLGNHYLNENSVIFIDEIEANLHPELIYDFLSIIVHLAKAGIQFFISTHSYFVIKSLYILAHTENIHIPTISIESDNILQSDLFDEMPSNPIIGESINLYKREISL